MVVGAAMPVGDGSAVLVFDASRVDAFGLPLLGGVGCCGGVASGGVRALRRPGGKLEASQLAEGQGGPLVEVVLLLGQQLPRQAVSLRATATVAMLLPRRARTR